MTSQKTCPAVERVLTPGEEGGAQDGHNTPHNDLQTVEIARILSATDYHKVLDLPQGVTDEQVRRQYRVLALRVHPDKNKHPGAGEAFMALALAFTNIMSTSVSGELPRDVDAHEVFQENSSVIDFLKEDLNDPAVQLRLSKHIGHDWMELGMRLNMEPNFLMDLSGHGVYRNLPFIMLMDWECKVEHAEQKRGTLAAGLMELGRPALAHMVMHTPDSKQQEMYAIVAKEVSTEWKALAISIGVHPNEISSLEETARSRVKPTHRFENAATVLREWKQTQGKAGDRDLLFALKDIGRQDVIEHLCGWVPHSLRSETSAAVAPGAGISQHLPDLKTKQPAYPKQSAQPAQPLKPTLQTEAAPHPEPPQPEAAPHPEPLQPEAHQSAKTQPTIRRPTTARKTHSFRRPQAARSDQTSQRRTHIQQSTMQLEELPSEQEISEWIADHHSCLSKIIMQVPLGDLFKEMFDLSHNFIAVDILLNPRDSLFPNRERIEIHDILARYRGMPEPTTILLSGPAGSGKTSFIRGYINNSCQEPQTSEQQIMVILVAKQITSEGIWKAIEQALMGDSDSSRLLKVIRETNKIKLLVFIDGVDEVREKTLTKSIQAFVEDARKKGRPIVFLSTRENRAGVDKEKIDRELETTGFTIEQGLLYVSKHCEKLKSKPEAQKLVQYMQSECQSNKNIQAILQNPLRLLLVLLLALSPNAGQSIKIDSIGTMRVSDIYNKVESLLLTRETSRPQGGQVDDNPKKEKLFYAILLMTGLSKDIELSEKLFSEFGFNEHYPLIQLLSKTYENVLTGEGWIYQCAHESFLDYFMAKGALCLPMPVRELFLFYLASSKFFHNSTIMLFGCVSTNEHLHRDAKISLLTNMVRWQLIMWPDEEKSPTDETYKSLRKDCFALVGRIKDLFTTTPRMLDLIEGKCSEQLINEAERMFKQIQETYDGMASTCERETWLRGTIVEGDDVYTSDCIGALVYSCLQELPEDILGTVAAQTIGILTPCSYIDIREDRRIYYHLPGTARWGHVVQNITTDVGLVDVCAWHPADSAYILEKYQAAHTLSHTPTFVLAYNAYFHIYGGAPIECCKQEEYKKVLDMVPVCQRLYLTLDRTPRPYHRPIEHVLPGVEALYSHLNTTSQGKLPVWVHIRHCYLYVSEMSRKREMLKALLTHGSPTVGLWKCRIIVDEEPDDDLRATIIGWWQAGTLSKDSWYLPDGRRARDMYNGLVMEATGKTTENQIRGITSRKKKCLIL